MVEYGKAIQRARQQGWENAYLNYDYLKDIIAQIEACLFEQTPEHARLLADTENPSHVVVLEASKMEQLDNLKSKFFKALHSEIEKISLFTIKEQGELADAIGGARFESSGLFDKKALNVQFTRDKLDMYAAFSVELARLIKYICINSIGIQKILKKYGKVFARLDEPHFYFVESNHLKQLASSESMAAIHASLQTILDESSQAETVTNPETAVALLRFQCILACTTILRRNATIFQLPFVEFLSKQSMIATEAHFGGMDAKGQRALRWLLYLEPQRLRQMDQAQLERMWHKWSVETEIVRSFLDGGLPYGHRRIPTYIGSDALDAMLEAAKSVAQEEQTTETTKWIWGGVNGPSMLINLFSILLYTINYYIVAPTANHYAIGLGYDGAFGATLIGASSFSAIFSAFLYSLWYTRLNFKSALIFSAICPFLGNLIYAIAISYDSMTTAIIGRILCGFGSAEVLNRQLISTCVSFEVMTKASALFVAFGASGMSIGPLIAGILDMTAGRDFTIDISLPFMPAGGIIYNHVTAPGFVMAVLWSIQLLCLLLFFEEPNRVNTVAGSSSDDEASDKSDPHVPDIGKSDYGSIASSDRSVEPWNSSHRVGPKEIWQEIRSTWGLIFENSGLPLTLLIFSYIEMADEIIISSCSMIVRRYFDWHGSVAGFFIASLGALVLPAHFVVEKASHHFSERRILLRSLVAIIISTCLLFNYSGALFDALGMVLVDDKETVAQVEETKLDGIKVKHILTADGEVYYNWGHGIPFYVGFLSLLFMSTIVLEGVDTSIMAKVTPQKLNEQFINVGLLATLIGTLGRVVADSILTVSALLDISIFVDFVNATFVPVLLLACLCLMLVWRHYDSLL